MSNTTLKGYEDATSEHTDWDGDQPWWDISKAAVRMNYHASIDAPLTTQGVIPGSTLYVSFRCAVEDPDAYLPDSSFFCAGFYGEQDGEWDWLKAASTAEYTISGTVENPRTLYYQIVTTTNRGYATATELLEVAVAPSEEDFQDGARVSLTWPRNSRPGVTGYDVYRYTPAGLLAEVDDVYLYVTNHGLQTNDWVVFTALEGGTVPPEITPDRPYQIQKLTVDSFTMVDENGQDVVLTPDTPTNVEVRKVQLLFQLERNINYYVDNDSFLEYDLNKLPAIEFTGEKAFAKTIPGSLVDIPYLSQPWAYVLLAVQIPETFDATTMRENPTQWFRLYLSDTDPYKTELDVRLPVSALYDSEAYRLVEGSFKNEWLNKQATVTRDGYSVTAEITGVITFEDDPQPYITLSDSGGTWDQLTPGGVRSEATMIIEGAVPASKLLVDMVYAGYSEARTGIAGAFHPEDLAEERGQWRARPAGQVRGNSTTLPGDDDGDDGGPIVACVAYDESVIATDGKGAIFQMDAEDLEEGVILITHEGHPTKVESATWYDREVWQVTTANGFSAEVSSTHKFITHPDDEDGVPLGSLAIGDEVLTCADGVNELSSITNKIRLGMAPVIALELEPDKRFVCGKWEPGICRKWGGIVSHNKITRRPPRTPEP